MPVDISEDCLVVFDGIIKDLENPVFILRNNSVSLAYTTSYNKAAWCYDEQEDAIVKRQEIEKGFASKFIELTGLLNHSTANMNEPVVTKEMVTYKAIPTT